MKSIDSLQQDEGDQVCPKRLWVLTSLSDDELLGDDQELPQGLQFHLSRCASCRDLANRLIAVAGGLRGLSAMEPDEALADRAQAQALTALRGGAKLTGRVSIPDEPELEPPYGGTMPLWRYGRLAVAAGIILAFTIVGLSHFSRPYQPAVVKSTPEADTGSSEGETVLESDNAHRTIQGVVDEHLAAGHGNASEGSSTRPYRIRRHHSHIEAALADEPGSFQSAFILPDPAMRNVGWKRLFDSREPIESTRDSQD